MNWCVKVLTQYSDYSGRARRTEFWMFTLISVSIGITLTVVDYLVFGTGSISALTTPTSASSRVTPGLLNTLYGLAVFVPGIAVAVRRLQDTDRSGWWCFIVFVPLVGVIVLLVFLASAGTRGRNRYGADPKAVPAHGRY